jgi:hypothetical protein
MLGLWRKEVRWLREMLWLKEMRGSLMLWFKEIRWLTEAVAEVYKLTQGDAYVVTKGDMIFYREADAVAKGDTMV